MMQKSERVGECVKRSLVVMDAEGDELEKREEDKEEEEDEWKRERE